MTEQSRSSCQGFDFSVFQVLSFSPDAAERLRDPRPPDLERCQGRTPELQPHARLEGPGLALKEQVS